MDGGGVGRDAGGGVRGVRNTGWGSWCEAGGVNCFGFLFSTASLMGC